MASTNKTPNYDLPQWVETDEFEMADFNQAMSDIDSNLNLVQSELSAVKNSPVCVATKTLVQAIPNNLDTTVVFQSEEVDTHNMHSNSANTERITIPENGTYLIVANIAFSLNASGRRMISLMKNGVVLRQTQFAGINAYLLTSSSFVAKLVAGDYLYIRVYQDSGASLNIEYNPTMTNFSVMKIAE